MIGGRRGWPGPSAPAVLALLASAGCQCVLDPGTVELPGRFTYSEDAAVYSIGQQDVRNVPLVGGVPLASYEIDRPLPAGLHLDLSSGYNTGSPAAISRTTSYHVTATNTRGHTSETDLSITVNAVSAGNTVRADGLAAGSYHTCALLDGRVLCWGHNGYGQLGNGDTAKAELPVLVSGLEGVRVLVAGPFHTCAIADGGPYCWGYNEEGQIGDDTRMRRYTPVPVLTDAGDGAVSIAAGLHHTCLVAGGRVQCWGYNKWGQLGLGALWDDAGSPMVVQALPPGAVSIAAGFFHTCALLADGGVHCWGRGDSGQLGNGARVNNGQPVQVAALPTGVRAIAAGSNHTCAIADAGVWCWGQNFFGQLGDGSTSESPLPVQVLGLGGVSNAAGGSYHTCAVADGGVQCWGYNDAGQIGDGSKTNRLRPVPVPGLPRASRVAAGADHTCALADGGIFCWGDNDAGQLGNDSFGSSLVPIPVHLQGP